MRCLSIRGEHVLDIFHNGKDVENRSWQTHYRGPLLIHASGRKKGTPQGVIYGIVDLYDCVDDSDSDWAYCDCWHWCIKVLHTFRNPIPYKGQLSIYRISDAAEAAVLKQIPGDLRNTLIWSD